MTTAFNEHPEIRYIAREAIPALLEKMPYYFHHKTVFNLNINGEWMFSFYGKAMSYVFNAAAVGKTPLEAFSIAQYKILQQLDHWHETRFLNYKEPRAQLPTPAPRVLIVDDDVDLVASMQVALNQLGCQIDVATKHEGLHQKIIAGKPDYILLDWKLGNQITADMVVERSMRLINTFSDIREKFRAHKPRVVTYSALKQEQIILPEACDEFFQYMGHWRKPMPLSELIKRTSELIRAN